MDPTTRALLDEIVKRLGVVEAHLPSFVKLLGHLGGSQRSGAVNRAGRKDETAEIAAYANELRLKKTIWKEVWRLCKRRWPGNMHVENQEQVRAIWRRHYRKRKQKAD